MNSDKPKTILMTAFEPSGDALGAMAARGLKKIDPSIRIAGLGGQQMEFEGVDILAHTTRHAAMGVGAIAELTRVKRLVDLVGSWIKENAPDVIVAVDSPAANWPVCKVGRRYGCSVVHLAGPQLWAWAPWRIRKMRQLSDHVMCLLPFEPEWFESRGVPATFIGHPAMINDEIREIALPVGKPNIVLLPGSRKNEIKKNLPMQQEILQRICIEHPSAEAVIACRGEDVDRVMPYSNGLKVITDELPTVLDWADLALNVSGTVSLHVMRHGVPMIGMYKVNPFSMIGSKIMLTTPYRLLPNLIAGKQIVPEFIPCGNNVSNIAGVALNLLANPLAMRQMGDLLKKHALQYENHDPEKESAELILQFA